MKHILRLSYLFIFLSVMRENNYTASSHSKKKGVHEKNRRGKLKQRRKKFQLTKLSRNPQTMLHTVEDNIEKTLEAMSDESILKNGGERLIQELFPSTKSSEENTESLVIGDFAIQTSIDKDEKKFLEEHLEFFTIMALYDALTTQFHLNINPLSWKIKEEKHDEIRLENEKLARAALQDSANFSLLVTHRELIKKMVLAVLKNLYYENKGESQKGILGRSWDKIRGKATSPMAAFVEYIENNELIKKLNKFTDNRDKAISYYACLTALKLTKESSVFNEILSSPLFVKMVGAMCYPDLDPRKAENDEGSDMVTISLSDKKNSMNLYKKLFDISDAKLPQLIQIKGAEYALESTTAIRLLTIGAGGLAIAGAAAATAIGYRGYKDPANKEPGFFNKLGSVFKNQWKKDYFKKTSDRENKKDQLDSTIEDKKIESPIKQKEELNKDEKIIETKEREERPRKSMSYFSKWFGSDEGKENFDKTFGNKA